MTSRNKENCRIARGWLRLAPVKASLSAAFTKFAIFECVAASGSGLAKKAFSGRLGVEPG